MNKKIFLTIFFIVFFIIFYLSFTTFSYAAYPSLISTIMNEVTTVTKCQNTSLFKIFLMHSILQPPIQKFS